MKNFILLITLCFSIQIGICQDFKSYYENKPIKKNAAQILNNDSSLLDSVVATDNSSKKIYSYDNKGNRISEIDYNINGIYSAKYECTFDENNNKTSYMSYSWSDYNKFWSKNYRYDYFYDNNSKLIASEYYSSSKNTWIHSRKTEYTYNENGSLLSVIFYSWNDYSMTMDFTTKYEYSEFNKFGEANFLMKYKWDKNLQEWIKYEKRETELNENSNTFIELTYLWNGSEWKYDYKFARTYTTDEKLLGAEQYSYDTIQDKWIGIVKSEYIYTDSSNTFIYYDQWNDSINTFIPTYKFYTQNNNQGQEILNIRYIWNSEGWIENRKIEKQYDLNGNDILETEYEWTETEWKSRIKTEYTYDSENNKINRLRLVYTNSNLWIESENENYYYSKHILSNINDIHSESNIRLYPNPATSTINIEQTNSIEQTANIYNTSGQTVKTLNLQNGKNTFDISNLKSGIYFINLSKEKTIKLIKK